MTDFLNFQLEGTDPLEFLKLTQGHNKLKLEVEKQKTMLSDIETEIAVNQQSLQIKSDKTIKSLSLDDTQNEKQIAVNKVQINSDVKQMSTTYRKRLFKQYDLED